MKTTLQAHSEGIRKSLSEIENGKIRLLLKPSDFPDQFYKIIIILNLLLLYLDDLSLSEEQPIAEQKENIDAPALSPQEKDRLLIEKVTVYLMDHLRAALPSPKEIAGKFSTNQQKLKVAFKKKHGSTMHQFHARVRLEAVYKEIERDRYETLVNIASKFGFHVYHSFYESFKKQFGRTPESLRKQGTTDKNE